MTTTTTAMKTTTMTMKEKEHSYRQRKNANIYIHTHSHIVDIPDVLFIFVSSFSLFHSRSLANLSAFVMIMKTCMGYLYYKNIWIYMLVYNTIVSWNVAPPSAYSFLWFFVVVLVVVAVTFYYCIHCGDCCASMRFTLVVVWTKCMHMCVCNLDCIAWIRSKVNWKSTKLNWTEHTISITIKCICIKDALAFLQSFFFLSLSLICFYFYFLATVLPFSCSFAYYFPRFILMKWKKTKAKK